MTKITEYDVIMCYKIVCKVTHQKYVRPTPEQVEAAIKAFNKMPIVKGQKVPFS